jgi:hypothetical protein
LRETYLERATASVLEGTAVATNDDFVDIIGQALDGHFKIGKFTRTWIAILLVRKALSGSSY